MLEAVASFSISAEKPLHWTGNRLGPPPEVFNAAVNCWDVQAFSEVMKQACSPEFLDAATTAYHMCKLQPEDEHPAERSGQFDKVLGIALHTLPCDTVALVKADQRMTAKSRGTGPPHLGQSRHASGSSPHHQGSLCEPAQKSRRCQAHESV